MPDANWKREERTVAKMFGSHRQLMKGTNEKSDVESELFVIDVKLRKTWSVNAWYRVLREAARKKGKIPILTVRRPGEKLRLAVLDLDYLISALKGAGVLDLDSSADDGA